MIDFYEICGYLSGILFGFSLFPQLFKSCKKKEFDDISLGWQSIFILALLMNLVYSFHKYLPPIFISSSFELLLMIILLMMKLYYKKNKDDKDKEYDNLEDIENP